MLFVFTVNGISQTTFKKVDSTSYALYQQKKWKELASYSNTIIKENFDYYVYNLRVGIAYFELKKYKNAITYFKKALHNNTTSKTAEEYLYWSYLYLEESSKAKFYFKKLDKQRQQEIVKLIKKPIKFLDFIYLEGGQNIQNPKKDNIGNITYANLGLQHQITHRINFYHAFYYQDQKFKFSNFNLQRYYAKPTYLFNKGIELEIAVNYVTEKNDINFSQQIDTIIKENDILLDDGFTYNKISTFSETNTNIGYDNKTELQVNLLISKTFQKLKIGLFGGISSKKNKIYTTYTNKGTENVVYLYQGDEVYNEDFPYENITTTKKDSVVLKTNFGMLFGYDVTKKLGIAFETTLINYDNKNELNYVGTISYKWNKNFNMIANYIQKGNFEYYYYNSAYLITGLNKVKRIGLTNQLKLSKLIDLYAVYQHDITENKINNNNEQSNTFIIGLKFKL